jgi:hypothetical protein
VKYGYLILLILLLTGCTIQNTTPNPGIQGAVIQIQAQVYGYPDKTYPIYPNFAISPGDVMTTNTSLICTVGYTASIRNVPSSLKTRVYAAYNVTPVPYAYEIDHIISLELGGSNDIKNLFPQPYNLTFGARQKDVVENYLHRTVCNGSMSIEEAQRLIVYNWTDVYVRIKK